MNNILKSIANLLLNYFLSDTIEVAAALRKAVIANQKFRLHRDLQEGAIKDLRNLIEMQRQVIHGLTTELLQKREEFYETSAEKHVIDNLLSKRLQSGSQDNIGSGEPA